MSPPDHCELCGKTSDDHGVTLVEMAPGPDRKPWHLCVRDYVEGRRPQNLGNIPAQYKNVSVPIKKRKAG